MHETHGTNYMFSPGSQYPYYKHHPRQCTRHMVLITCFHQGVNNHTTNTIQDSTLSHGTNYMFSPGSQYPYYKHHAQCTHMVLITCFHQGFNNHTTNTIQDSTLSTWYSLHVLTRESISILQTPSKTVHETHGTNYMFSPGSQYPYYKHHPRQCTLITCFHTWYSLHGQYPYYKHHPRQCTWY